jgi:hypothetical protein
VYLSSAFVSVLEDSSERRMNNLRRFNSRGESESHPLRHAVLEIFSVPIHIQKSAVTIPVSTSKLALSPAAYLRQAGESATPENSTAIAWVVCKNGLTARVECAFAGA